MRGLPIILSLFCNEFNKFNNTGVLMLDSIYHMILEVLLNRIFGVKTLRSFPYIRDTIMYVITVGNKHDSSKRFY